jgi:hypothetical protein
MIVEINGFTSRDVRKGAILGHNGRVMVHIVMHILWGSDRHISISINNEERNRFHKTNCAEGTNPPQQHLPTEANEFFSIFHNLGN